MHLGNIECRLEGLNYRLKYCWPKVIYFIYQPNEVEREIKKKTEGAKQGAKQKSGGAMAHPGPPLESPLVRVYLNSCFQIANQLLLPHDVITLKIRRL